MVAAAEAAKALLETGQPGGRQLIAGTLRRADEPGELLAYWMSRYGRAIPKPVKRGIGDTTFRLLTEYHREVRHRRARLPVRGRYRVCARGRRRGAPSGAQRHLERALFDTPWPGARPRRGPGITAHDPGQPARRRAVSRPSAARRRPAQDRGHTGGRAAAGRAAVAERDLWGRPRRRWATSPAPAPAQLRRGRRAHGRRAPRAAAWLSDPEQVRDPACSRSGSCLRTGAAPLWRGAHPWSGCSALPANEPALTGRTLHLIDGQGRCPTWRLGCVGPRRVETAAVLRVRALRLRAEGLLPRGSWDRSQRFVLSAPRSSCPKVVHVFGCPPVRDRRGGYVATSRAEKMRRRSTPRRAGHGRGPAGERRRR